MEDVNVAPGRPLFASAGEELGPVAAIYLDDVTGRPTWLAVDQLDGRRLVPADGARMDDLGVRVAYTAEQIAASPQIDDEHVSEDIEESLYRHYGVDYTWEDAPTQVVSPDAAAQLTRHEEELQVGKRSAVRGRIRLRKWVETDPVSMDVQLRREVAHILSEPVGEFVGAHEFGEDEIQIAVHAEEPIVQKHVVAKERIGVQKTIESSTRTVADEVRKERVEVEQEETGEEER